MTVNTHVAFTGDALDVYRPDPQTALEQIWEKLQQLVQDINALAASGITFTPVGSIAAITVQLALAEVASEAATALTSGLAGKQLTIAGTPAEGDIATWVSGVATWQAPGV